MDGGVAQWLEQSAHNRLVESSILSSPTKTMPSLLREFLDSKKTQRLTDVRNIGLYIFTIVILAITWSGIKTVQTNYELQKKIATLKQQNTVLDLQNGNSALQNEYYKTAQYLELAARQQLGLAAPGETVLLVPQTVALKHFDSRVSVVNPPSTTDDQSKSKLVRNVEAWRDFLFGHKLTTE